MQKMEKETVGDFTSFDQFEDTATVHGMQDWAVPWADLMMVMFVLFVVLFIYAGSHKDVKVLFSSRSAAEAKATSSLDPLIGLIGQISSRAGSAGTGDVVGMTDSKVLYRSRESGISVVQEAPGQVRISLRGALFFDEKSGELKPDAGQYLDEIAKVVSLNVGTVHVIGFADPSESMGAASFSLSTTRAAEVAGHFISRFGIEPKRIVITGRGAYQPELPETSEANRESNRRVEIVIVNPS
ncbi:MAG: OmpA family protein [Desulfovibrionaceae bacterium]|nr:OmpA family protein [Desulfovibrionaceae bacterium]